MASKMNQILFPSPNRAVWASSAKWILTGLGLAEGLKLGAADEITQPTQRFGKKCMSGMTL